ncbi:MAG TPA: DUF2279 domain-containing protein [Chitinophagaceae bacterium]|nr:DUF2279 domain-containing protein [Chitinophagaceae bacterium]
MRSAFLPGPASVVSLTASFGKKPGIFCCLLLISCFSFGQIDNSQPYPPEKIVGAGLKVSIPDSTLPPHLTLSKDQIKKRQFLIGVINIVGYGGSLIILNNTWYKNYPHTSFHTFNDSKEWLQVDKFGHAWTAYNAGRASAAMWQWAGLKEEKSALIGGVSGAVYLTVIEFLDAHSSQWGWSWSDIGANIFGSGFFISQELLWKQQRIQYKFSFHHKNYGEPVLNRRADDLFGKVWYERMLKDYNAQTYWLSANLKSFFHQSSFPAWLNVSFGYGADGMFGGFDNKWVVGNPGFPIDRTNIPRKRQFYISPDVDFTKIRTNKKWLHTVFFCLNAFKCPAPTLMIDSKGKLKGYAMYF